MYCYIPLFVMGTFAMADRKFSRSFPSYNRRDFVLGLTAFGLNALFVN